MYIDNVELVRSVYRSMEQGDIAGLFSLLDPNVIIEQTTELPWGGAYRGIQEAQIFFKRVTDMLETRVLVERFIDSTDHVLAIGRTIGKIKQNGKNFDVPLVHIWHVQNERIQGLQVYLENASMLLALA